AEEISLGYRNAFIQLGAGIAERHADRLRFDDRAKLTADRFRRFGHNDLQAVEQWQTGLDASHDDIDSIGKAVEEFRFPEFRQKTQNPKWNAATRGETKPQGRQQANLHEQQ